MAGRIHRITMFKLPDPEGQQKLIDAYKTLGQKQKKDGKPYILSMTTGPAMEDPRSQGWTVVSKTEFASLNDMKYYDDQCEAHAELKSLAKGLGIQGGPAGVMTVYFEAAATL
ncbi:stress responsive A/B barrel domain-containing protein [Pseudomassariella vexata]|uniref:Stress responsive A/B barrel domain-containing protein n=1 Tax=Pseudomassariella vexata TaxID=1141098 RepID=A0A1Y2D7P7_9PEZI|nr:stress responsive A/B barrel domain-containing protein [Pseudomassariella vexata]ORY55293.1 stress responsive A/B barrel domain-containing protein [Pseudomassariella vexata]